MAKDNKTLFIFLLIIGVILAIFVKLDLFSIAGRSCNFGSWHISSYDAVNNKITISAGVSNVQNSGCLGTYDVTSWDRGGLNINDKTFCNSFFGAGSWSDENNVCTLINEAWFNDKEIKSKFGTCVLTQYQGTSSWDYNLAFDGFIVSGIPEVTNAYGQFSTLSCNGGFIIGFKNSTQPVNNTENPVTYYRYSSNACSVISLIPSQKTNNDYLTLSECQSKITTGGACTMDAKQCPDGSYVGRNPNDNCNYYSCPTPTQTIPTLDLNAVVFKLGDFGVTWLIILLVAGGLIIILILKK